MTETDTKHTLVLQLPQYLITSPTNHTPSFYNRIERLPHEENTEFYSKYPMMKYLFSNHNYFKLQQLKSEDLTDYEKTKLFMDVHILQTENYLFDFNRIYSKLLDTTKIIIQRIDGYGTSNTAFNFYTKCIPQQITYQTHEKVIPNTTDKNVDKWIDKQYEIPTQDKFKEMNTTILQILTSLKTTMINNGKLDDQQIPRISVILGYPDGNQKKFCLCRNTKTCQYKHYLYRDKINVKGITITAKLEPYASTASTIPLDIRINNANYFKLITLICSELATLVTDRMHLNI